jgi:preprotein translocase subunit SecD
MLRDGGTTMAMTRRFLLVLGVGLLAMLAVRCGGKDEFGTILVLEPQIPAGSQVDLDDVLQQTTSIIERRAEAFGIGKGVKVERQDPNLLVVRLTGVEPSEAVNEIGRTGLLEFRELVTDGKGNVAVNRNGQVVLVQDFSYEEAVWIPARAPGSDGQEKELTSLYLTDAFLGSDAEGLPTVHFRLDSEGAHLLEEITTRLFDQPLAFFLDGEPIRDSTGSIEATTVRDVITDSGAITGLSAEDADYLTKILKSGTYPVPLRVVGQSEFGKP